MLSLSPAAFKNVIENNMDVSCRDCEQENILSLSHQKPDWFTYGKKEEIIKTLLANFPVNKICAIVCVILK